MSGPKGELPGSPPRKVQDAPPIPREGGGLTDEEHAALDLSSQLADALHRICFQGDHYGVGVGDWAEAAADIHRIQHRIMAQAAARAYPDRYRLLGGEVEA